MIIQCPKCNKKYIVDDNEVPSGGAAVECPNCGNIFTIYRNPSNIRLIPYEEGTPASKTVENTPSVTPPVEEPVSEETSINKTGEFPEMGKPEPVNSGLIKETEQADKIASDFEKILNTSSTEPETVTADKEEIATPPKPEPTVSNDKISALWEKFKTLSGEQPSQTKPKTAEEPPVKEPTKSAFNSSGIGSETAVQPETELTNTAETVGESISAKSAAEREKARKLARALAKDIKLYHGDKVKQGLEEGNLVELIGSEIKKSWRFYQQKVSPEILNETTYFEDALNEILANGQKLFKFKQ